MDRGFWRDRHVFLTGHTGFKGAWLSLWLHRLGARVTGYSLPPPTAPSLFQVAGVGELLESHTGDVRDLATLSGALRNASPEIVIHMAAQPLVRDSYDDPVGTYATNVMGTVHVLEAIRQTPSVRVGLIVTSDKCYDNREWLWGYREIDPMGGHDPYSNSKGCAELVTDAYRRSFFQTGAENQPTLASARAGNVIGGGDWAKDRMVPDLMRAYDQGQALRLRNPSALRPWQHALEPLSGYLLLCEFLWREPAAYSEAWNFGPFEEDNRTVAEVIEAISARLEGCRPWVVDDHQQPHEAQLLKLDCSKALARLGWKPCWRLDQAIEATADWYQAYYRNGAGMREFSLNQIDRYEKEYPAR